MVRKIEHVITKRLKEITFLPLDQFALLSSSPWNPHILHVNRSHQGNTRRCWPGFQVYGPFQPSKSGNPGLPGQSHKDDPFIAPERMQLGSQGLGFFLILYPLERHHPCGCG